MPTLAGVVVAFFKFQMFWFGLIALLLLTYAFSGSPKIGSICSTLFEVSLPILGVLNLALWIHYLLAPKLRTGKDNAKTLPPDRPSKEVL